VGLLAFAPAVLLGASAFLAFGVACFVLVAKHCCCATAITCCTACSDAGANSVGDKIPKPALSMFAQRLSRETVLELDPRQNRRMTLIRESVFCLLCDTDACL
jgi:hypothetical protein